MNWSTTATERSPVIDDSVRVATRKVAGLHDTATMRFTRALASTSDCALAPARGRSNTTASKFFNSWKVSGRAQSRASVVCGGQLCA
jgi:hypothetical protein